MIAVRGDVKWRKADMSTRVWEERDTVQWSDVDKAHRESNIWMKIWRRGGIQPRGYLEAE